MNTTPGRIQRVRSRAGYEDGVYRRRPAAIYISAGWVQLSKIVFGRVCSEHDAPRIGYTGLNRLFRFTDQVHEHARRVLAGHKQLEFIGNDIEYERMENNQAGLLHNGEVPIDADIHGWWLTWYMFNDRMIVSDGLAKFMLVVILETAVRDRDQKNRWISVETRHGWVEQALGRFMRMQDQLSRDVISDEEEMMPAVQRNTCYSLDQHNIDGFPIASIVALARSYERKGANLMPNFIEFMTRLYELPDPNVSSPTKAMNAICLQLAREPNGQRLLLDIVQRKPAEFMYYSHGVWGELQPLLFAMHTRAQSVESYLLMALIGANRRYASDSNKAAVQGMEHAIFQASRHFERISGCDVADKILCYVDCTSTLSGLVRRFRDRLSTNALTVPRNAAVQLTQRLLEPNSQGGSETGGDSDVRATPSRVPTGAGVRAAAAAAAVRRGTAEAVRTGSSNPFEATQPSPSSDRRKRVRPDDIDGHRPRRVRLHSGAVVAASNCEGGR
jgi:hypothetical protein